MSLETAVQLQSLWRLHKWTSHMIRMLVVILCLCGATADFERSGMGLSVKEHFSSDNKPLFSLLKRCVKSI